MWAFWESSATRRRVAIACHLAVALGLLLSGPADAARRSKSANPDSQRVVRRVVVGQSGIEIIDGTSAGDSGGGGTRAGRVHVQVGQGGVRVEELEPDSGGSHTRRVVGPGLVVDVGEAGLVRLFSDAEVRPGERINGDVVAVFGSVDVEGQVTGDVVAVFGSVKLGPEAMVGGDVVSVGGSLDQAPGASVSGQSVSLGFLPLHFGVPPLQLMLTTVASGWLLSLLVGWLLLLLFPTRMMRVAATASRRTAGSFVLGLLSAPLLVIAIVLALVTVIGIPLAIVLPPLYALAVWAGQLAASYVLGCRLLRRGLGEGRPFAPLAAGTLFVALFFALGVLLSWPSGVARTVALFFNLLGALLVLGLSVIGVGAVLLSRLGSRPQDHGLGAVVPEAAPASMAGAPVVPEPPAPPPASEGPPAV